MTHDQGQARISSHRFSKQSPKESEWQVGRPKGRQLAPQQQRARSYPIHRSNGQEIDSRDIYLDLNMPIGSVSPRMFIMFVAWCIRAYTTGYTLYVQYGLDTFHDDIAAHRRSPPEKQPTVSVCHPRVTYQ